MNEDASRRGLSAETDGRSSRSGSGGPSRIAVGSIETRSGGTYRRLTRLRRLRTYDDRRETTGATRRSFRASGRGLCRAETPRTRYARTARVCCFLCRSRTRGRRTSGGNNNNVQRKETAKNERPRRTHDIMYTRAHGRTGRIIY